MPVIVIALKYWREIAVGLLTAALIAAGLYIKHVFAERDQLKLDNSVLTVQLKDAQAMQELTNRFTEAISQIRIRSNINVQRIESQSPPQFIDNSAPLVFIPGGMLQAVYPSTIADRTATGHAPGGDLVSGQPVR